MSPNRCSMPMESKQLSWLPTLWAHTASREEFALSTWMPALDQEPPALLCTYLQSANWQCSFALESCSHTMVVQLLYLMC